MTESLFDSSCFTVVLFVVFGFIGYVGGRLYERKMLRRPLSSVESRLGPQVPLAIPVSVDPISPFQYLVLAVPGVAGIAYGTAIFMSGQSGVFRHWLPILIGGLMGALVGGLAGRFEVRKWNSLAPVRERGVIIENNLVKFARLILNKEQGPGDEHYIHVRLGSGTTVTKRYLEPSRASQGGFYYVVSDSYTSVEFASRRLGDHESTFLAAMKSQGADLRLNGPDKAGS